MLHDNGIQVNGSFVLGFDHDRKDVFARTAEWIEENRLECATFHILTPYPATPLFRQMEAEGRLLHRDWSLYDTAHAVFRPRHMSPEELEEGYAWVYQRLFSHASIWRRRPEDWRAVAPYLAMSYLYKRSNRLWRLLIRHHLVHAVWSPLVALTRMRHLRFRKTLSKPAQASWPVRRIPEIHSTDADPQVSWPNPLPPDSPQYTRQSSLTHPVPAPNDHKTRRDRTVDRSGQESHWPAGPNNS